MDLYEKINSTTSKDDGSPELKRGEIKRILIENFEIHLPEFKFVSYRHSTYSFQRVKEYKGFNVWQSMHILFSLKDRHFSCSISSRINSDYLNSNWYNVGMINPHVDLITVKNGTGVIRIEDAYYFHNGKILTTTKVVKQICRDLVKYGIPELDRYYENLRTHSIINIGLDFINRQNVDKFVLKAKLTADMSQFKNSLSRLENPIYLDLKKILQEVPNQSREDRKKIPGLAFELLELLVKA